ncbi:MAG: hypothetical protein IT293_08615 [Deltaproteobacteria bacterium]|nr:hypothetical protein [Deltaproteobacteria bacterium]
MDLVPILATIVLIATLSTLVLGVLSYLAFRAREKRHPHAMQEPARKVFFVRLVLPETPSSAAFPRS